MFSVSSFYDTVFTLLFQNIIIIYIVDKRIILIDHVAK